MRKTLAVLLALFALSWGARAQFYNNGEDPARFRWFSVESAHYRVIYPSGADSLARNYARLLEQYRVATGRSIGYIPGEKTRRKMPVVLHTHTPYSNGSVSWAPTRMDLYTLPNHYGSDPAPWDIQLATHEPRHQAQMSFDFLKPMDWIIGEAWRPVSWFLYINRTLGEGDATVTETGMSPGTRARTADFLNYYRVAFDQGDFRSWNQWRWGSYKKYTPDLYTVGYLTVAGARYLYDRPLIMQEMLQDSRKHPWRFSINNFRYQQRLSSGKKFRHAFPDIMVAFNDVWQAEADARAPYTPTEQVTREESFPVEYASPVEHLGAVYLLRSGYLRANELGYLDGNGEFCHLHSFGSHTSSLFPDPVLGRLYWSETLSDPRWEMAGRSVIRYMDFLEGKVHTLTRKGRYYNPQPSPDGLSLSVVSAPYEGGSRIDIISSKNGSVLRWIVMPSGLQATETAWMGETLYVCAVSEGGYGIYQVAADNSLREVLAPTIQKVVNLGSGEDYIEWVSDRDGSNALYHYFPATGQLLQMTSTRFGATDFCETDDHLYMVSQTRKGAMVFRTPLDSLRPRPVQFTDIHHYKVEDVITSQESALGPAVDPQPVELSQPKRYYKLPHALRFHSWAPLYVNYDAVKEQTMDFTYETASLGASVFFQNTLGSISGMVGYGAHKDPENASIWRHSLHAKLELRCWYPVIEASIDFNDSGSAQYTLQEKQQGSQLSLYRQVRTMDSRPLVSASFKAYVPLSFSSGGINFGVTPQVKYSVSNNLFSLSPVEILSVAALDEGDVVWHDIHLPGSSPNNVYMQWASASLRGYVMRSRAQSQIYPRWGVGAEVGGTLRPVLTQYFAPNLYGYLYAYLPGLWRTQGLKLSAMYQLQLRGQGLQFKELAVNTLPRGFEAVAGSRMAMASAWQFKWTADYAIPMYFGEISMGSIAYIRNFVLTPHFDSTHFQDGQLWSTGADLVAHFGKLLMIPYETNLGVSFSYLGGSWLSKAGVEKPYYVGLVFNIDI